jgi:hypothetical protein
LRAGKYAQAVAVCHDNKLMKKITQTKKRQIRRLTQTRVPDLIPGIQLTHYVFAAPFHKNR